MSTFPALEQTAEVVAAEDIVASPSEALVKKLPEQTGLISDTETYSREVLGEAAFELYRLTIAGLRGDVPPWGPHPDQSPHIIDTDESMRVGMVIKFNRNPLTALLLCLGVDLRATFHFEGLGGAAAEKDLRVSLTSKEGQFAYWIGTVIKPQDLGLTPGYYQVAATIEVGPVTHKCGQYVFGYGYIGERRVQIARQPFVG
ncbi:MAG: hypothetical protein F6K42_00660 [Leptolyngbya sp. SIO1D8]|nr:hypothetical protein [Leptolyngbya sp. SIO1D8]